MGALKEALYGAAGTPAAAALENVGAALGATAASPAADGVREPLWGVWAPVMECPHGSPGIGMSAGILLRPADAQGAGGGALAARSTGASPRGGGGGGGGPGLTLSARLAAAERAVLELGGQLGAKADDGALREVVRALGALQRQADHASEGVRTLTQTTYRRVDEHAGAIQKLTLVSGGDGVVGSCLLDPKGAGN